MQKEINVVFVILPNVHLLDLAGPVQVFFEANQFGAKFNISYCGIIDAVTSKQGLNFCNIQSYKNVKLISGDFLFIAGIDFNDIREGQLKNGYNSFYEWLQMHYDNGVNICSICSGAFVLATSGMLKNKVCTTHWKCIDYLNKTFPDTKVVNDQLFVKDGHLYTSAGMTTGIDLALFIVEELYGPITTSKVAREMVVFIRRTGEKSQKSIYLDFRTHLHPAIHKVQDYMIRNPILKHSIYELAEMVNMSERNLTRLFKKNTGISIADFKTKCRLEYAETLLRNPDFTIDYISAQCGFKDSRHLRRLWKEHYGKSPSKTKAEVA